MSDPTPEPYQPPTTGDLTELVRPSAPTKPLDEDPSLQVELAAKVLLPLVILLIFLVSFLMVQVGGLSDTVERAETKAQDAIDATEKNRETGYQNRAVSCVAVVAVVGKDSAPESCFEKGPLKYYDPDDVPVSSKQGYMLDIVCELRFPGDVEAQTDCVEEAG